MATTPSGKLGGSTALLAVVVGAGLSVVDAASRAMVRNALADPYVRGVSSGGSVGAASVILSDHATGSSTRVGSPGGVVRPVTPFE